MPKEEAGLNRRSDSARSEFFNALREMGTEWMARATRPRSGRGGRRFSSFLFCSNANHHPRDELIRKVAKRNELLGLEQVQRARIRLAIIK